MTLKTHIAGFRIDTGSAMQILATITTGGEAPDFDAQRATALRAGHTIVEDDGTHVWRVRRVNFNSAESGSQGYTWHKDGRRVRCTVFECRRAASGEVQERRLRAVWMKYEEVT